jgi:hypothetical protein
MVVPKALMDTNHSFSLSLIGFDEQQIKTFLAIFSLAERKLEQVWTITNLEQADFFLFATEKSDSVAMIAEKKLAVERCLFYTANEDIQENNEVLMDVQKIPRLLSLVTKLNQIAKLAAEPAIKTETVSQHKNVFFIPEQSLLKTLLHFTEQKLLWTFYLSSVSHTVYIDLLERTYYYSNSLREIGLCLDADQNIIINTITKELWDEKLELLGLASKPLNNLIWYVTFKLSKGLILQGHSPQDIIYLTRWPDLGIQDCGKYVKLAAFMRNNATYLTDIAAKTGFSLSEIHNFYNACYLIGIVEKTENSELRTKTMDQDKQRLLGKINNRLERLLRGNQ